MNSTYIHLVLNHVAVLGAVFSFLLFIAGIMKRNETISTIAFAGFVISALAAIPVFLTGEPAEDSVKNLVGVFKPGIEEHEEAAEVSLWLIEILGIISLTALLFRKRKIFSSIMFVGIFALLSSVATGAISYTGYLGGKIRHTEIAGTSTATGTDNGEQGGDGDRD
ncbi:MAG: hypothetical protein NT126_04515 [Bacteroidetes bacterium]|nr:hypothetical protein [Bacteroidota bacterium]